MGRGPGRVHPQLLAERVPLEQLRDQPTQRQGVWRPAGGEVLERLVRRGESARDEVFGVLRLERLLERHAEAEAARELEAPHPGRVEGLRERGARLRRGGRPGDAAHQGADRGPVEGQVERDPPAVVPLQLRPQVLDARRPLARPDADVVDVDLVLDRDEVDGAEQLVERHERRVEVLDRLVEGAVLGRVEPRHAQEARQQVGQPLAQLPHLVGEGPVLPDPRPPQGPGQSVLGAAQLVGRLRRSGLIHGGLPGAGPRARRAPPGAARPRRARRGARAASPPPGRRGRAARRAPPAGRAAPRGP